jgi:hypothetical protein
MLFMGLFFDSIFIFKKALCRAPRNRVAGWRSHREIGSMSDMTREERIKGKIKEFMTEQAKHGKRGRMRKAVKPFSLDRDNPRETLKGERQCLKIQGKNRGHVFKKGKVEIQAEGRRDH